MPMYEYSDNYAKRSGSLWKFHQMIQIIAVDSESFNFKARVTQAAPVDGNTKDVEIVILFKYVTKFWKTLKMPVIKCEIRL